jgi:hypothetical protein
MKWGMRKLVTYAAPRSLKSRALMEEMPNKSMTPARSSPLG